MHEIGEDLAPKHESKDQNIILEEYNHIVESLKRDLHHCKVEQSNIRVELDALRNGSQNINEIRDFFNRIHLEECGNQDSHNQELTNLQERLALLQMEKDSVMQLWHISLNTIDVLEDELKAICINGKDTKFYQEQANKIKETYSEAIKTLESKLLQARENFLQQQALCQTNKEKIECLTKEKNEITKKFQDLQNETQERDRNNLQTIESLKRELSYARAETKKAIQLKQDIEEKLNETKRFAENIVEKDKETKVKMAEAIELIESVVREKDLVLHREALVLEEKARLEVRIATIANEYDTKIQELNTKVKNEHEQIEKQHSWEIKQLKSELKEKSIQLEHVQKELKLTEEELIRVRRDSEDMSRQLNAKILDYEQKSKHMEIQLQVQDDIKTKSKHDSEIKQLKQKISNLEGKLIASNDKLRKLEQQNSSNKKDYLRQPDRRTKNLMEQYANLETQLTRTLGDKEDLLLQLKALKHDFEYEIHKRDNERHFLENKIHELEINLQKANYTKSSNLQHNPPTEGLHSCLNDERLKRTLDITVENKCHCCQSVLSEQLSKLQEKFDKRTKELIHHVQVHQKLSKRWRDEAKSLTARFQAKTKNLRSKIARLQNENSELSKELLICRQQLTQQTMQEIHRFNDANEVR